MSLDTSISRRAFILLSSGVSLSLLLSCHRDTHWIVNDDNIREAFREIAERFMTEHKPNLENLKDEINRILALSEQVFALRLWEDIENGTTIRLDNWIMPRSLVLLSTTV